MSLIHVSFNYKALNASSNPIYSNLIIYIALIPHCSKALKIKIVTRSTEKRVEETHTRQNCWLIEKEEVSEMSESFLLSGVDNNTCLFSFGNCTRLCGGWKEV